MILDWKKFVLRSDIKNLPLEEQRRKFLQEQLYHDNLISEQRQRQYEFYMSQMESNGGPGGGSPGSANGNDGTNGTGGGMGSPNSTDSTARQGGDGIVIIKYSAS